MMSKAIILVLLFVVSVGCQTRTESVTFKSDVELLSCIDDLVILKNGQSQVAVSGKLQARVFTSSSKGLDGVSYGWFKRKAIKDGSYINHLASIGGESRLWFGPEIGKYALFFKPGFEQNGDNIVYPKAMSEVLYSPINQDSVSITYGASLTLMNFNNYTFEFDLTRKISVLNAKEIENDLGIVLSSDLSFVAFEAQTTIVNTGTSQWKKENGLFSLWELSCLNPSEQTKVVIPVKASPDSVTVYFSDIDSRRFEIKDDCVFYRVDAKYLNKIGIKAQYATPIFGSYNPELSLLTIVKYTFTNDSLYVNSHWINQEEPYGGDVINVFNDGKTPAAGPFGPFYELETSSCSKELNVGETLAHSHSVYHFEGGYQELDLLSKKILGVSLETIGSALLK